MIAAQSCSASCSVFRRVVVVDGDFGIGNFVRRIKQAEFETRPQGVIQRLINILFGDQSLLNRPHQGVVIAAATEIAAGLDRGGGGLFGRVHIMMLPGPKCRRSRRNQKPRNPQIPIACATGR